MSAEELPNGLLYGKLPGNKKVPILYVVEPLHRVVTQCTRIFLAVVAVLRRSGGKYRSHLRRQCGSYKGKRKSEYKYVRKHFMVED